jgi:hypothetical protein
MVCALAAAGYTADLGPGVYDVHSPVVPDVATLEAKLRSFLATGILKGDLERLWVNPDCGLKVGPCRGRGGGLLHGVCGAYWPLGGCALRVRTPLLAHYVPARRGGLPPCLLLASNNLPTYIWPLPPTPAHRATHRPAPGRRSSPRCATWSPPPTSCAPRRSPPAAARLPPALRLPRRCPRPLRARAAPRLAAAEASGRVSAVRSDPSPCPGHPHKPLAATLMKKSRLEAEPAHTVYALPF